MALLFSAVTVTAGEDEIELLVGGIPREYDDLEGWSEFDDLMCFISEETEVSVRAEAYLVHRDADIGVCPADGLRLDALPEKIQTAWNDVLAAQVCWIRQGAYGPEIVLAGVDPQRVYDFSFMLIEEIDECPGQAAAPGLSME